jgi:hypothetical protein
MTVSLKQSFLGRLLVLVVISFYCIANAQELATTPAFEVSTVRPSSPDTRGPNLDLEADAIRSSVGPRGSRPSHSTSVQRRMRRLQQRTAPCLSSGVREPPSASFFMLRSIFSKSAR